jgi:hypothetical protein
MMQELWEVYKPHNTDITPSEPKPKTTNEFLLFLDEQGGDMEVLEDEYAHYYTQPVIKIKHFDARDWWL